MIKIALCRVQVVARKKIVQLRAQAVVLVKIVRHRARVGVLKKIVHCLALHVATMMIVRRLSRRVLLRDLRLHALSRAKVQNPTRVQNLAREELDDGCLIFFEQIVSGKMNFVSVLSEF